MKIGDPVVVVDPWSARHGNWGTFEDLTRDGQLHVRFADGEAETMSPFQLESSEGLARATLAMRTRLALAWRQAAQPERAAS
jgi:hypothetical protein